MNAVKSRNSFLIIGLLAVVVIAAVTIFVSSLSRPSSPTPGGQMQACTMEAMICPDGTAVGRTGPNCEFAACPSTEPNQPTESSARCTPANLTINQPTPGFKVAFPLTVAGVVNNSSNKDCSWTLFEGQAGHIVVKDETGAIVGEGPLTTMGDWMTDGPVQVQGRIELSAQPSGHVLTLMVTEEDPSGQSDPQQIILRLAY